MKRLTAYVSGTIQKVGYRARVVDMARLLGLKGTVQNLEDGRVKVIAEGEENDLERFLKAIDIRNTIIRVSSITTEYTHSTGDFEGFYKQVDPGETDSRLDQGVVVLIEILGAIKDMDKNLSGKIDDARADIVGEIRELRREDELAEIKGDVAAIKAKLGL